VKCLVLLCLGADITLLSVLPDSDSKTKSNSKVKKECLRVTMVHGDIVVLTGSRFEVRKIPLYSIGLIFFSWLVFAGSHRHVYV
jgi:hypothetical protein